MTDYDPHDWRSHLLDIKGSMLREIFFRVLTCVIWCGMVVAIHQWIFPVAIPGTPHSLVGLALGLLLVFRTTASYDRFWEGRKQWGSIVNQTRNLARMVQNYLKSHPDLVKEILQWTAVFPWSLMHHLRGNRGLGPKADSLPALALHEVNQSQHLPYAVARRLTHLLAQARQQNCLTDYGQWVIDQNVQALVDYLGACERIHKTPMPFAYMVHLRRALIIYCYTLPFALLEPFHWLAIPATLLIAYILFGIEEIGVEIEDPFGTDDNDLPLERFCQTIKENIDEVLVILENPVGTCP